MNTTTITISLSTSSYKQLRGEFNKAVRAFKKKFFKKRTPVDVEKSDGKPYWSVSYRTCGKMRGRDDDLLNGEI
jgi:hypothetical protein